jgi:protein-S-isoprenylcysteine O-methyltransferase Ste14
MNVWVGKVTLLLGIAIIVAIRAPHGKKRNKIKTVKTARGKTEIALLTLAWLGSVILPVFWVVTPFLSFADYPLHPPSWLAGVILFSLGLWIFYRSHEDLSTNWSLSVDILENHSLVTKGLYRHIRHPMYAAIFLQGIGQALIAPNWLVGPSNLCAFILLFSLRLPTEERMMLQHFGIDYEAYRNRTKRIIPGVW